MNKETPQAHAAPWSRLVAQQRVLAAIEQAAFGLTSDEVAARIGAAPDQVAPRIVELQLLERVKDWGGRRRDYLGHDAVVWVAHLGIQRAPPTRTTMADLDEIDRRREAKERAAARARKAGQSSAKMDLLVPVVVILGGLFAGGLLVGALFFFP